MLIRGTSGDEPRPYDFELSAWTVGEGLVPYRMRINITT